MSLPRSFSYLFNEIHFRQLNKPGAEDYLPLVLAAYASACEPPGSVIEHPWLRTFYQQFGSEPQHTATPGKGHTRLYIKKILNPALHGRSL